MPDNVPARPAREFTKRILYVFTCTAIIYLTVPIARNVDTFLRCRNLLRITIYAILIMFILTICFLVVRYIGFRLINFILLAAFMFVYILIIEQYNIIVEKIHFVEYGFLAFLVYFAYRVILKGVIVYPVSLLTVALIGWGDETIQHFLPDRVYDNRDVFLNALSGALILLLIYIVEKMKVGKEFKGT